MVDDDLLHIGSYAFIDIIAKTSSSIVKLARKRNCLENELFAVKIISKKRIENMERFVGRLPPRYRRLSCCSIPPLPTGEQRVLQEVAVLKKLRHKNIVRLFEVLNTSDHYCFVFEYLEGGRVICDVPLALDVAWLYFRDVVEGLYYLHCNQIVHLDLKPGNLLLTKTNKVKIVDFGICQDFSESDNDDDLIVHFGRGTPCFRSPESLSGNRAGISGRAVDIWCLGVTLYVMVHGQLPFSSDNVVQLYDLIIHKDIDVKDSLPQDLKRLIWAMLVKDPKQRISLEGVQQHRWTTKKGTHTLSNTKTSELVHVSNDELCHVYKKMTQYDELL